MKKLLFLSCIIVLLFILSCQSSENNTQKGEQLAQSYCASCHQFPKPSLLDKATWEQTVLPRMGYMMGIYEDKNRAELIETAASSRIEQANIFPKSPTIDLKDWQKIKAFYTQNAPDALEIPKKNIQIGLKHFTIKKPSLQLTPPSTTMIQFNDRNEIYLGDAHTQKLIHLDPNLELIKAGNISEGLVNLQEINNELWMTVMGSFSPTDAPSGFVLNMPITEQKQAQITMENLQRPVHSAYGDLNGDNLTDVVICEFGKWTGQLSLFLNKGNKTFEKKTLLKQAGATRSYLHDFNQDGLLDIIALFGQGNEGFYIFYNQNNGNFRTEHVLPLPAAYGSSFFEMQDIDADGDLDIVYTAGDNADYNPLMKPYHGIYIFENDGKNHFEQSFFYPMNGAYGAKWRDFDLDGDLDIAAISFFPDYKNEVKEAFLYLENDGNFNFSASTFADVNMGRWIVMDAKDMDNDGDEDLILGSLAFEVIPNNGLVERWTKEGLPFIILENTIK